MFNAAFRLLLMSTLPCLSVEVAFPSLARADEGRDEKGSRAHVETEGAERRYYGRLSVGVSHFNATGHVRRGAEDSELQISGVGPQLDSEIAWRVAHRLHLGGALALKLVVDPTLRNRELEAKAEGLAVTLFRVGPTVTVHVIGDRGLYARVFGGFTLTKLGAEGNVPVNRTDIGPMLAGAVGYDFLVARAASLGVSVEAAWASVANTSSGSQEQLTIVSPTLGLSGSFGGS